MVKGLCLKNIFIALQVLLYGAFLTLDLLGERITMSNSIKFAVVVLCFMYIAIRGYNKRSREFIYLFSAMLFTLISDIFILLSDYYLYGVITFIIAQQLYGARITELFNPISKLKDVCLRLLYQIALGILLCMLLNFLNVNTDALLTVSVFYFISICTNVVRSIKLSLHYSNKRGIRCFAVGFLLFLLCDINVGLFNLSGFLSVGPVYDIIYGISSILMWTFYAPSQVLIALSVDTD
ncbi:MAG: hypothetical protein GX379_05770 [Clostridiales bacterium]|nr:hypothetical protein [Clostridiales bacterium]